MVAMMGGLVDAGRTDWAAKIAGGIWEMPLNEHFGQAVMSLKKLASPDFGVACFTHGEPIKKGASRRFMKRWRGGRRRRFR